VAVITTKGRQFKRLSNDGLVRHNSRCGDIHSIERQNDAA
jgi:hypothetical protein